MIFKFSFEKHLMKNKISDAMVYAVSFNHKSMMSSMFKNTADPNKMISSLSLVACFIRLV